MFDNDYPVPQAIEAKSIGNPSMKVRLDIAIARAEKQLMDAKRAKEIFEKNPELEELINLMNSQRF